MLIEFTFTPTESKYLIAKAVARMDRVQNALKNGILAMHPSSSTYFLSRELAGEDHHGKVWVTGTVVPKALCVDSRTGAGTGQLTKSLADPGKYPHTVVYHKGKEQLGWTIYDLVEKMGPGDIYFKGVNAVDADHVAGILLGSMVDGTIGMVNKNRPIKGYEIYVPVGLEKLIPGSVKAAAKFIDRQKEYSMGVKFRMFPLEADQVITEREALKLLAGGGEAVVFSAGGLQGAGGAVSIAFDGSEEQCAKLIEACESVKGATIPDVVSPECATCLMPTCHLGGNVKPWVTR